MSGSQIWKRGEWLRQSIKTNMGKTYAFLLFLITKSTSLEPTKIINGLIVISKVSFELTDGSEVKTTNNFAAINSEPGPKMWTSSFIVWVCSKPPHCRIFLESCCCCLRPCQHWTPVHLQQKLFELKFLDSIYELDIIDKHY
jgi:hypothetical protein